MSAGDRTLAEAVSGPELPELFVTADLTSGRAQQRFLRSTKAQLALLVVAATAGLFSISTGGRNLNMAQIVAMAAFLTGGVLKAHMSVSKPDRIWYEARAAAESARTLAWRYAMCGQPFRKDQSAVDTDHLYLERLHAILEPLRDVPLIPSATRLDQITPWMRTTRELSLDQRKDIYRSQRIEDEEHWYASKAASNARLAGIWSGAMVAFEMAGALGTLLAGTGAIHVDVSGLAATLVGVATAWMQTKQHQSLASAYSVAARELSDIRILMEEPASEESWARFVDNAEGAISREHTLWSSSRSR